MGDWYYPYIYTVTKMGGAIDSMSFDVEGGVLGLGGDFNVTVVNV